MVFWLKCRVRVQSVAATYFSINHSHGPGDVTLSLLFISVPKHGTNSQPTVYGWVCVCVCPACAVLYV